MIVTPKMWNIKKRIEFLEWVCKCDSNDYLSSFELEELRIKFHKLNRIEELGLRVIKGCKGLEQTTNPYTSTKSQIR